jgi:hypothetical protein
VSLTCAATILLINKTLSLPGIKKYITHLLILVLSAGYSSAQSIVSEKKLPGSIDLKNVSIYTDENDFALIKKSAELLQADLEMVIGIKPQLTNKITASNKTIIIIGSVEQSSLIKQLVQQKKINNGSIKNKWEAFQIQTIRNPFPGITDALVIIGSDRRGTAFGVFELSKQIGVSPWYWWADVPVKKKSSLYINANAFTSDAPKVKYRGIFINDEAPALSGWSKEKFGGFNHLFYEKVFELILRLKGNYLWPAMWGNAFYDDDSLNIKSADEYGIVIGTSHHEPLMRAHDEWRRYGNKKKWDYDSTEAGLKEFWRGGMKRATNEKIVSVGMRGDGDAPMSRQTATALLERIVKDQRQIIEEVTGKPASETPQLWALYKEVQDYYDKGMRVPDDVTLLLCDDNWGNIRKLPKLTDAPRKGGYGIYYHFDYVGGPRNYKWVNTNPLPRIWEQMHLAYEYGVKDIWIVNVGDIKPMEFPISFFLDYAWNPDKIGAGDLQKYSERWAAAQFGNKYAKEIADILATYSKYNGRRKPELLDANTYSLDNYEEFWTVVKDYKTLLKKTEEIGNLLPKEYYNSYFQFVLHPVKACSNLYQLYYSVAMNKKTFAASEGDIETYFVNGTANSAKKLYLEDSLITLQYHQLNNGKWNHMMSQTHIGYTNWQQPAVQRMPLVRFNNKPDTTIFTPPRIRNRESSEADLPANDKRNLFYEEEGVVSIEASHFTKAINNSAITWKVLPDHGRTGDAVTTFPVTAQAHTLSVISPHLQYEFYIYSKDNVKLRLFFSPTLNFHAAENGLQFAVSIDDEQPQIISLNKEDNTGVWNQWMINNIITKTSNHYVAKNGKHTIKYWMINSGIVLQKIVADFGGVKQSYFGPPETRMIK